MNNRSRSILLGLAAAAVLVLPAVSAVAQAKKDQKKPADKKGAAGNAKAGQAAFAKEGCAGCHKAKDQKDGGALGPDLTTIGKEKTADKIKAYIQKPKAGSQMPAYKGPAGTLADMTAYLAGSK